MLSNSDDLPASTNVLQVRAVSMASLTLATTQDATREEAEPHMIVLLRVALPLTLPRNSFANLASDRMLIVNRQILQSVFNPQTANNPPQPQFLEFYQVVIRLYRTQQKLALCPGTPR